MYGYIASCPVTKQPGTKKNKQKKKPHHLEFFGTFYRRLLSNTLNKHLTESIIVSAITQVHHTRLCARCYYRNNNKKKKNEKHT